MHPNVLCWLHVGDVHVTFPDGENLRDLRRIVTLANGLPPGSIDFVVLPGDNADDGTAAQFSLVRDAVAPPRHQLHILPGDHDFKPGDLQAFYRTLGAAHRPNAVTVRGSGAADFRLGAAELGWIERQVAHTNLPAAVFLHAYPTDLREGGERPGAVLADPRVRCVDMGHTHYNELANDGGTIFMATRSTGQIEEGPAGLSVAAIDGDDVSWRFKTLNQAWPCVLVTRPADRRMVTQPNRTEDGPWEIRAKVLGDALIEAVEVSVDDGDWAPMIPIGAALWQVVVQRPARRVCVRALDAFGRRDQDAIDLAEPGWVPPPRYRDGSDRDRVGAWLERGILDTQLGPNRNGRAW